MAPSVYLDTNVFVDAFERVDTTPSSVWPVLRAVEIGEVRAVTSELTLAELLPKLIVDDESELIALYQRLFSEAAVFKVVPVTRDVLMLASQSGLPSCR